jgi:EAL domain-containing protein (putative c-di-GMP-specific phosphodiesterase class I)
VADIKQIVSGEVAAQIMSKAQLRLEASPEDPAHAQPWCYLGQLGADLSLLILATADRDEIHALIAQIHARLRQPIDAGPTGFQLTPYAGVAILGQDASAPNVLLELARAAATQARRTGSSRACFSSDSPGQLATDRVGIARELRKAIANREIGLRYESRHELATGRLVARVAHLRWRHPAYGELHPLELVRLAEITGLAPDLSRAALKRLRQDFAAFAPQWGPGVRISFGAPKQHILHPDFIGDIEQFLAEGIVPPERLELRISVKASVARQPADFEPLTRCGVQLVVDDLGRGMDLPLSWLARAPIRGLQLNRGWVSTIAHDADTLKMCRAGVGIALALGLTPIANGVDDPVRRDALLALGCTQGIGALYRDELCPPDIIARSSAVAAA